MKTKILIDKEKMNIDIEIKATRLEKSNENYIDICFDKRLDEENGKILLEEIIESLQKIYDITFKNEI